MVLVFFAPFLPNARTGHAGRNAPISIVYRDPPPSRYAGKMFGVRVAVELHEVPPYAYADVSLTGAPFAGTVRGKAWYTGSNYDVTLDTRLRGALRGRGVALLGVKPSADRSFILVNASIPLLGVQRIILTPKDQICAGEE